MGLEDRCSSDMSDVLFSQVGLNSTLEVIQHLQLLVDSFLKKCDIHPTDRVSLAVGISRIELDFKHIVSLENVAAHLDPFNTVLQLFLLEFLMLSLNLMHQLNLLLQLLREPVVVLRQILIRYLLPL